MTKPMKKDKKKDKNQAVASAIDGTLQHYQIGHKGQKLALKTIPEAPTTLDVMRAAQAVFKTANTEHNCPVLDPLEEAVFDASADAAEILVVTLLRVYPNRRMLRLALNEITSVINSGDDL